MNTSGNRFPDAGPCALGLMVGGVSTGRVAVARHLTLSPSRRSPGDWGTSEDLPLVALPVGALGTAR